MKNTIPAEIKVSYAKFPQLIPDKPINEDSSKNLYKFREYQIYQ